MHAGRNEEMKCFHGLMTDLQAQQMVLNVYNLVNVLKILNFPVFGKIGFNVYTGLLYSKVCECMSLCTFRG